jgi:hypothetical protein
MRLKDLIHPLEGRVTGPDVNHVLSHLFDDFGRIDTRGALIGAAAAGGTLKKSLDKLVRKLDGSVHDFFEHQHLSSGVKGWTFGQPEYRAHRSAESAA